MQHTGEQKSKSISSTADGPIVFIINSFYPGGAERLVIDDTHEMLRRGMDVRIITLRREKESASFAPSLHISPERWSILSFRNLFDIAAFIRLVRLLCLWHPRAVITHLWLANTVGRIAARIARVPRIISFEHNVYDTLKSSRHFFTDRLLARISHCIVAVSETVKTSLCAHGIAAESTVVVPNGIDLAPYRTVSRSAARKKFSIPEDAFVFLFIGRFIYQKGLDVLIDAFAQLQGGLLFLVGDGPERTALERQAKIRGVASCVRFFGFHNTTSDVAEFFASADCFVLPSRWEGLPIVLIEALAAGRALITSDIPSIREVVTPDTHAILFPPENSGALTAAMRRMLQDTRLRQKLEVANLVRANDFSIELHVQRLMQLIRGA